MVDFFGHQDRARKNTGRLVFYFTVAIGLTICLIYLALAAILFYGKGTKTGGVDWLINSELFMWASAGTLIVVALGSLFKIIELSAGGKAVAEMLGGQLLDQNTRNADERKLLNVVEEMAIASGVAVPDVYLLAHEGGINAFAAGNSINDAVIGVTRGCMEQLDRDELQGVIAHEFSHILNGDMKLNLRLTGWIHGLLCIAIIGRILLQFGGSSRSRSSNGKGGSNPVPLIGLALMVVGGIGMLAGKLIKAAVSRQREFLADASAVQFTRNPGGLAGAFKKIGGLYSKLETPKAEEASHLFFGNGLANSFFQAFSTHPPLAERLRRIDPNFKGSFDASYSPSSDIESKLVSHLAGGPTPAGEPRAASAKAGRQSPPPLRANRVVEQIGQIDREHLDYASGLLKGLPPVITRATHETLGAVALCYSLLLGSEKETRDKQHAILQRNENAAVVMEMTPLVSSLKALDGKARIPLIELAMPALRQLSPAQFHTFRHTVKALSAADRQIDLFEFALEKILLRHLEPTFATNKDTPIRFHSINPLLPDCNVLISALAYLSHQDTEEVERSYAAGVKGLATDRSFEQLPLEECGLGAVDKAMDRLAAAGPAIKKRVVNACAEAVTADGVIEAGEAELLRAICASVDVPCPPLM